jgi:hypothetical protein
MVMVMVMVTRKGKYNKGSRGQQEGRQCLRVPIITVIPTVSTVLVHCQGRVAGVMLLVAYQRT